MRLVLTAIVAVPLLAACGKTTEFRLDEASCGEAFLVWSGGLTFHILQGGGDGAFDYDPPGAAVERIAGSYDLTSGDFSWTETFHPDSWRTGVEVDGYGTAYANGDLDVYWASDRTDVLGDTRTVEFRQERTGCDSEVLARFDDVEVVTTSTYAGGVMAYTEVTPTDVGEDWVAEGEARPDHTWTETVDFAITDYEYTASTEGDAGAGTSRTDFTLWQRSNGSTYEQDGYEELALDGSQHRNFRSTVDGTSGTWDYTVDYAGDGAGTYTQGSTTCSLSFDANQCSYDCGGGQTGSCS